MKLPYPWVETEHLGSKSAVSKTLANAAYLRLQIDGMLGQIMCYDKQAE
jgi:hypothetical protein